MQKGELQGRKGFLAQKQSTLLANVEMNAPTRHHLRSLGNDWAGELFERVWPLGCMIDVNQWVTDLAKAELCQCRDDSGLARDRQSYLNDDDLLWAMDYYDLSPGAHRLVMAVLGNHGATISSELARTTSMKQARRICSELGRIGSWLADHDNDLFSCRWLHTVDAARQVVIMVQRFDSPEQARSWVDAVKAEIFQIAPTIIAQQMTTPRTIGYKTALFSQAKDAHDAAISSAAAIMKGLLDPQSHHEVGEYAWRLSEDPILANQEFSRILKLWEDSGHLCRERQAQKLAELAGAKRLAEKLVWRMGGTIDLNNLEESSDLLKYAYRALRRRGWATADHVVTLANLIVNAREPAAKVIIRKLTKAALDEAIGVPKKPLKWEQSQMVAQSPDPFKTMKELEKWSLFW
jgi:hypothetical protein